MGEQKIKQLWTIDQVAEYLQLPRSTTYLLVAQGKIPHVKLGKHMRFNPDHIETALRKATR